MPDNFIRYPKVSTRHPVLDTLKLTSYAGSVFSLEIFEII